jgi:hypothetical protein
MTTSRKHTWRPESVTMVVTISLVTPNYLIIGGNIPFVPTYIEEREIFVIVYLSLYKRKPETCPLPV